MDGLLTEARDSARGGADVAPGSSRFWELIGRHLAELGELLTLVNEEVKEERDANSGKSVRSCIACGGEVIKRHVRGRWPLYCDECKLSDRS